MTDNRYPMVLYPPAGDMLIVENEQEHEDAMASWEPVEDIPDPEDPEAPVKRGPGRPRKNP